MKDRLRVKDVARMFGVSERKVGPMTERGEIPARVEQFVRLDGTNGERYVYSRIEIEACLRRRGELAAEQGVAS